MSRRIHYIDWLRVLAVLLLFPFHAGRVFNAGEPFYAKSAIESVPIAFVIGFMSAWHMPLLFFLAGASTCLAMRKRTARLFALERTKRLLVPLLFGALVIVPSQTWVGAMTNSGYTGSFAAYVRSGAFLSFANIDKPDYLGSVFSTAHLWFIEFLWVFSIVVLPLLVWGRTERGSERLARLARAIAKPAWWPVVVFGLLTLMAAPEVTGKVLAAYLGVFILGYIAMHDDAFAAAAERFRWPGLLGGTGIIAALVSFDAVGSSLPEGSLPFVLWWYAWVAGVWLILIAAVGMGRRLLDRPSPALSYLSEASYPVYILHQTVIVVAGFYLVAAVPSPWISWPLLTVASAAVAFGLYELVRRTPVTRFLFGMRPAPREASASAPIRQG